MPLKIKLTSVPVDDQAKAERFYTDVLGFAVKQDIPMGGARWLTVVSPNARGDVELLLEPMGHPAAPVYQKALYDAGIPWTAFEVDDIDAEYERLTGLGVAFRGPPNTAAGMPATALFDDTCGNLIQIYEV